MRSSSSLVILTCLLLCRPASAAQLSLVWEYPRSLSASGFTIQATAAGQARATTLTVQPFAPGACAALNQPANENVYCAVVGCPPQAGISSR
jgi:hypothetical protein